MLRDHRLLGRQIGLAHLLGVAAHPLARLVELELDEGGAQALDLLAHRGARVERPHLRAERPGRRDRRQPGDARADDEHLRRLHPPGRRHLTGEEAPEVRGRLDDGAVAGDVGHRRQRVHPLRARDARDGVHRQHRHLARGQPLEQLLVLRRPDEADQRRPFLEQLDLVLAAGDRDRLPHLQHHVRLGVERLCVRRDGGARLDVGAVGERGVVAGARLDDDVEAELANLVHRVGHGGHARLVRIDLLRDTHLHGPAAYNADGADCYLGPSRSAAVCAGLFPVVNGPVVEPRPKLKLISGDPEEDRRPS